MLPKSEQDVKNFEAMQSRFIGRLFVVPLGALLLFVVWVVVASVLTPLRGDDTGAMLAMRFILVAFGSVVLSLTTGTVLWRLTHWTD